MTTQTLSAIDKAAAQIGAQLHYLGNAQLIDRYQVRRALGGDGYSISIVKETATHLIEIAFLGIIKSGTASIEINRDGGLTNPEHYAAALQFDAIGLSFAIFLKGVIEQLVIDTHAELEAAGFKTRKLTLPTEPIEVEALNRHENALPLGETTEGLTPDFDEIAGLLAGTFMLSSAEARETSNLLLSLYSASTPYQPISRKVFQGLIDKEIVRYSGHGYKVNYAINYAIFSYFDGAIDTAAPQWSLPYVQSFTLA